MSFEMQKVFVQVVRFLCEALASAVFVVLTCILLATKSTPYAATTVSGFAVTMIIHMFGDLCPAHANPTVTLTCFCRGFLDWKQTLLYIAAQITGAIGGYLVLVETLPPAWVSDCTPKLCLSVPDESLELFQVVGLEMLHMVVVLMSWELMWNPYYSHHADNGPILVGCVFGTCSTTVRKYTGVSLNLARTLAAAIVQGDFKKLDVYLEAHLMATITCYIFFRYVMSKNFDKSANDDDEEESPDENYDDDVLPGGNETSHVSEPQIHIRICLINKKFLSPLNVVDVYAKYNNELFTFHVFLKKIIHQ